ncbi:MAG: FAD-dependent oxidoreductase [Phycisphaerales bacterium]|nr:FAD-dependent oxidoreductase [Phycisphaerales bacterium]
MDLRSGEPYFVVRDGPVMSHAPLAGDASCDVLVVGAGITGALTAYRAAQAGMSVIVLDKRNAARGSTAASTAIMQYEIDTPLAELGGLIGAEDAALAYRLCYDAIGELSVLVQEIEGVEGVDCELRRVGSLYVASSAEDAEGFAEEVRLRQSAGIKAEVVKGGEVAVRFGIRGGQGGKGDAIYSTNAATVNAYRLAHALLHRCVGMGVRVHGATCVTELERRGEGIIARTEAGPTVRAKHAVVCTGYEAAGMFKEPVVELMSTYAMATAPVRGEPGGGRSGTFPPRCVVWESARPYLYVRSTGDGRAIVGGEDEPIVEAGARDALIARKCKRLAERARELFTGSEVEAEMGWAGTFGETRDGLAYIGESPEHAGVLFNLGFGGNGMTFALIGAGLVVEVMKSGRPSELRLFRFGR